MKIYEKTWSYSMQTDTFIFLFVKYLDEIIEYISKLTI
jgi:hypothetical protein